jgi:hypothetical protein
LLKTPFYENYDNASFRIAGGPYCFRVADQTPGTQNQDQYRGLEECVGPCSTSDTGCRSTIPD